MNEKFFALPRERRQKIINAGYRVFSQSPYRKSPVSEIAAEAGISKSLLFHYFRNKRELYLFLWDQCAEVTIEYLTEFQCYEQEDLFESMYRGMQAKMRLMKQYPDMGSFVIRAFYEKEPEVCTAVQESYRRYFSFKAQKTLLKLDPEQFVPGLDVEMMYRNMYLASEGYLWEMTRQDGVDVESMERDFTKMIEFWKSIYLRKEAQV